MDLLILILEILAFYIIHHKFDFMDAYPYGWRENSNRVIGVMFTFPFFLLFFLVSKEKPFSRAMRSYLIAYLGSGLGTSLGWMSDGLR